jgi:hypothetical protein
MILDEVLQIGRKDRLIEIAYGMYILKAGTPVVCNDGYEVSIQCSKHSYCDPKKDLMDVSKYNSFELGFPNTSDELLDEYAEDDDNLLNTIYPYVPRSVVEALIAKHDGIKSGN